MVAAAAPDARFHVPVAATLAAGIFAITQLASTALAVVLLATLGVAVLAALALGLRRTLRGAHLEPDRLPAGA